MGSRLYGDGGPLLLPMKIFVSESGKESTDAKASVLPLLTILAHIIMDAIASLRALYALLRGRNTAIGGASCPAKWTRSFGTRMDSGG